MSDVNAMMDKARQYKVLQREADGCNLTANWASEIAKDIAPLTARLRVAEMSAEIAGDTIKTLKGALDAALDLCYDVVRVCMEAQDEAEKKMNTLQEGVKL